MAKLTLQDVQSGYSAASVMNANNAAIEAALENTLSRDGTTPNEMDANLDMDSNEIINLGPPTTANSAARLADVTDAISGAATAVLTSIVDSGAQFTSDNVEGALQEVATALDAITAATTSGSYTGTLTGMSTSPTVTIYYAKANGIVTLAFSGQSATSNANSLTITGMPAGIRPTIARQGINVAVIDNGTTEFGQVDVETSGTLTFFRGANSTVFTTSGSKGVRPATITYPV